MKRWIRQIAHRSCPVSSKTEEVLFIAFCFVFVLLFFHRKEIEIGIITIHKCFNTKKCKWSRCLTLSLVVKVVPSDSYSEMHFPTAFPNKLGRYPNMYGGEKMLFPFIFVSPHFDETLSVLSLRFLKLHISSEWLVNH